MLPCRPTEVGSTIIAYRRSNVKSQSVIFLLFFCNVKSALRRRLRHVLRRSFAGKQRKPRAGECLADFRIGKGGLQLLLAVALPALLLRHKDIDGKSAFARIRQVFILPYAENILRFLDDGLGRSGRERRLLRGRRAGNAGG